MELIETEEKREKKELTSSLNLNQTEPNAHWTYTFNHEFQLLGPHLKRQTHRILWEDDGSDGMEKIKKKKSQRKKREPKASEQRSSDMNFKLKFMCLVIFFLFNTKS